MADQFGARRPIPDWSSCVCHHPGVVRKINKDRNLAERCWHKVKQFRRVARRYDKTARNFLAFVQVASVMVLLR
jgi:transposase